jgi:hypothetical protein
MITIFEIIALKALEDLYFLTYSWVKARRIIDVWWLTLTVRGGHI